MNWKQASLLALLMSSIAFQEVRAQREMEGDKLPQREIVGFEDDRSLQSSPVDVHMLRQPSFGSFYCGSITIELDGTCTAEGDIV